MADADLAIFLPSLAGGGAERVMVLLCNAFSERGYRVDLVLADKSGPYLDTVSTRVRIVDLQASRVLSWPRRLAAYLRRARPPVLLAAMTHANIAAIAARVLARAPTRVYVSERVALSKVVETSDRPLVSLLPFAARLAYPKADGVIAVSFGVADDLSNLIGLQRERISVVYNPVVTPDLLCSRDSPLIHEWVGKDQPPLILAAGRLSAAKDHLTLLEAFSHLHRDRACRLVILGEGPLRGALEDRARDLGIAGDVQLPGFQTNPFNWMRAATVFALSSKHEGLPGVLIQAMACGTPVVSTDCPSGPAEILEGGKWGRLVPVGDAAALATALAATLDEELHPDVERRASEFSLEQAVQGYARAMRLV